jgi:hypothetical protein
MTRIAERQTRMRGETNARYRGIPIMIDIDPHECIMRLKGKRTTFSAPWPVVYELGMKIAANEARRLKLESRKRKETK